MEILKSLSNTYSLTKFWIITALISGMSVILLPELLNDIKNSTESGNTIWMTFLFIVAVFGICLLPFAVWQHIQRKSFFIWLQSNWDSLEAGVIHPEGYSVNFDTKLIRYTAVFSIVIATISFESRPYVYEHRTAGMAQVLFTLFSAVFGWWYFGGIDGVVSTTKAIHSNLRGSNSFTLRSLLEE